MTGKIKVLDEHTANQIAAGEVVERPASVVKELIENAIDAGSTAIEVEIKDGGLTYIRITDNGEGMGQGDAITAFERHATSKIADSDDLNSIQTLGFRGEALPSIAAVSKVKLTTRPRESLSGSEIVIHGGRVMGQGEVGCPPGTRIVVEELFYNTPARRKFLKGSVTEGGNVGDVVTRMALANPRISFKFINNGREVLNTPGSGRLLDVIIQIYGVEVGKKMIPIEFKQGGIKVGGYIARPEYSRSNRNQQTVLINGRYVRSQTISNAVAEGYHSLLEIGRLPVFVLGLEVDAGRVDVNVHPTKMEVRIDQEGELKEILARGIKEALQGTNLIPEIKLTSVADIKTNNLTHSRTDDRTATRTENRLDNSTNDKIDALTDDTKHDFIDKNRDNTIGDRVNWNVNELINPVTQARPVYQQEEFTLPTNKPQEANQLNHYQPVGESTSPSRGIMVRERISTNDSRSPLENLIPIGQVETSYIIAKGLDGMYIIDQHAAHERILYERFMAAAARENPPVQQLLMPITLELTHGEAQLLIDNVMVLHKLGFLLEHFGGDTFLVRAVPQGLTHGDEKQLVMDILDCLADSPNKVETVQIKEKIITTMACKAAVKANDPLTHELQEELLLQLAGTQLPYTCPHGRPTIIHLSLAELEKKFKRV